MRRHASGMMKVVGTVVLAIATQTSTAALAAEATAGDMPKMALTGAVRDAALMLWPHLAPILAAFPSIPGELVKAWTTISSDAGLAAKAMAAGLIIAVMLAAAFLARRLVIRRVGGGPETPAVTAIFRRFAADFAGAVALVLTAILGMELFLDGSTLADFLGMSVVEFLVRFEIARIIPAILYRPGEPSLRLMPGTEPQLEAGRPYLRAALFAGLGFPALIPVFIQGGMAWNAAQALAVLIGTLTACLGLVAVWRFMAAGSSPPRRWRPLAIAAAAAFWLSWCYGVIAVDFPFFFAIAKLGAILMLGLMTDRLVAAGLRDVAVSDGEIPAQATFWRQFGGAIRRVVYVLVLAATATVVIGWLTELDVNLIASEQRQALQASATEGLAIFCLGYVAFEALMSWMRVRFAPRPVVVIPGLEDEDVPPATRLATVMPLLRGVIGAVLLATTTLIALSKLGLNTTPILAGAGILGLAVSFGSQSLVRDIVAGIFYMIDDAFRLGEYIEAGRLKGSVEHISLRSLRLRHQNGQIHTIPFGQMGSVTNYSRDWVTLKFNLRLSRDTDFDVVRKTVKAIGQEMLTDAEFGKEFIQPLKLQGVADILENALVMRFKFTVKPGKPTQVQREAIKRIVKVFAAKGINFAQNSVTVQSSARNEADENEAIAAAAATTITPLPARGTGA